MKMKAANFFIFALFLTQSLSLCIPESAVPSPRDFLGYNIGEKLTPWETEKSYFYALESSSSKIRIERYGKSTMGKDMILAIFFSGDPDKNVKLIKSLTEPLNEIEAKKVASEAKPILFLNCDIHSSEYETTESAMQFAYELLTTYEDLLDDVMVIINPSINPDGHDIYRQWYSMYKNTEYASTSPPNYHAYVDHDLNRDWHEGNTQEIRNLWKVFLKYKPQIFIDNHMMGSRGYRMYIPPERDPVNPEINSLVQIQKYIIGGYIMSELEKSNCTGVVLEEVYDLFYPGYGDSWPSLHNSIGCTWEIARGNGPEPIEIKFESLRDSAKIKNEHQQTPWPGGVWTIEEQIRYRLTGWRALLEITSALGEKILYNYYVMHMDDRNVKGAYTIPFAQKDAGVLNKMINKLIDQGVEVRANDEAFIVPKSNPMARVLLGVQELSVPYFYDVTAWNYGIAKGIEIRETDIGVDGKLVKKANISIAKVSGHGSYYVFNHTLSGIKLVNHVLKEGNVYITCDEVIVNGTAFDPGTFVIEAIEKEIEKETKEEIDPEGYNVEMFGADLYDGALTQIEKEDIALYYPNRPGRQSMDEGWTRMVLEEYGFDYERINTFENLNKYDVLILPEERSMDLLINGTKYPLKNGVGNDGMQKIKEFLRDGGKLITWGESSKLLNHILDDLKAHSREDVIIPGTFINVLFEPDVLTYGIDEEQPVFFTDSITFDCPPHVTLAEMGSIAAGYASNLTEGNVMVRCDFGKGEVIAYAFLPQYRACVDGSFVLLFNGLYDYS